MSKKEWKISQYFVDFTNDYILEVGNLGDTEAAEIEDFNVLEAPPGGHVRKPSIPPWFSDQESS